MNFTIEKELILNKIRIVEKITAMKGNQPILSNILIETISSNEIKLSATDLDMEIETVTVASVKEEGKITLPAKKLSEIIAKMPDKPINFELDEEKNNIIISCSKTKIELLGISAAEFPQIKELDKDKEMFVLDADPFIKAVKGTAYAAANYENRSVISGVLTQIKDDKVEMVATDGNRLTRAIQKLENKPSSEEQKMVIPSRALQEILRILAIENDSTIKIYKENTKIYIKIKDTVLTTKLLEGEYPQYNQLIPKTCEKKAVIKRDEFINSIDLMSTMVNEKTNFIKFVFSDNKLEITADTPESGKAEEVLDVDYTDEEQIIAFNYKYVLEALKNIESKEVEIKMNGGLSATIFEPKDEEDYLSLIMPIQIR